jgi:hypothetical protein
MSPQRYGWRHQQVRKAIAPRVADGTTPCSRCGEIIAKGESWHLDHTDDGQGYRGASHARCNIAAPGVRGAAAHSVAHYRGEGASTTACPGTCPWTAVGGRPGVQPSGQPCACPTSVAQVPGHPAHWW